MANPVDSDVESVDIDLNQNQHPKQKSKRPRVQPGPHLTLTDFGAESLSTFLQEQLKEKESKEQRLKNDPQFAAAEAEKNEIRRLVNSDRPITVEFRNERLEVRLASRRSHSVASSDGDNESPEGADRSYATSSSANSSGSGSLLSKGKKGLQPRLSYSTSNQDDSGLQDLPPYATIPPGTRIVSHIATGTLRNWRQLMDQASQDVAQDVTPRQPGVPIFLSTQDPNRPSATSSSMQQHTSAVFSHDLSNTGEASIDVQEAPVPDSFVLHDGNEVSNDNNQQSDEEIVSSNTINIKIAKTQLPDLARSLSFQKHAEETRNSRRASNDILTDSAEASFSRTTSTSNTASVPFPNSVVPDWKAKLLSQQDESDNSHTAFSSSSTSITPVLSSEDDQIDETDTTNTTVASPNPVKDTSDQEADSDQAVPETILSPTSDEMPLNVSDSDNPHDLAECIHGNNSKAFEEYAVVHVRRCTRIDYEKMIPEAIPASISQAHENRQKVWSSMGMTRGGRPYRKKTEPCYTIQYTPGELGPDAENILGAPKDGIYPRLWHVHNLPVIVRTPSSFNSLFEGHGIPEEIAPIICSYLSPREIRNLRLVNRQTAIAIRPSMLRSTVMKFDRSLFEAIDGQRWDNKSDVPAKTSLLQCFGNDVNKFGISFDLDILGLATAEPKEIEEVVKSWWGKYIWPKKVYPRFSQLKELEDLADSGRPLLKNTMKNLTNVSELAIAIDSGHGWLNGPDMSDMAILRGKKGTHTPIFGKTFDAPDIWNEFAIREWFRWGQGNTINLNAKRFANSTSLDYDRIKKASRYQVRDYDDYRVPTAQFDYDSELHTGALPPPQPPHPAQQAQPAALPAALPAYIIANLQMAAFTVPVAGTGVTTSQWAQGVRARHRRQTHHRSPAYEAGPPIVPSWPLLFNCHNLAAKMSGNNNTVRNQVAVPTECPILPGQLTEAQVQWLMETLWAQRAFLSAYTGSIIENSRSFSKVHSLHITKLSSGLIPLISQGEFWAALPGLKNLTLKIIPDWRQEHVLGDKSFAHNMLITPYQASAKLAELLRDFIAKLENLSSLKTGFVGGGEHQTGLFGRNRHVLPAPITIDPLNWMSDHVIQPDPNTMITLNHIRNLTFENCWFSPCMLEAFMLKSRDTSLHHLTLDSVSLTGIHDTRADGPLTTRDHDLKCVHDPSAWLHEAIPENACWANVLENITPGKTILDRKYDAQMIDEEENPRPEPAFKGHITKITLNSCGYVKISGVRTDQFGQNGLVVHPRGRRDRKMDPGLRSRKAQFWTLVDRPIPSLDPIGNVFGAWLSGIEKSTKSSIMMSKKDYIGLGKLTSCIHPIEKRVLERAWGMTFGWGESMERWAAVEDGKYPGGTGRFSGTIEA